MQIRKQMVGGLMAATVLAFAATTLLATTQTVGTVTLETPSYTSILGTGLIHCEPWNDPTADHITLSGVPDGSNVTLQFVFTAGVQTPLFFPPVINLTNVGGDPFTVNIPYPTDPLTWPYQNGSTHAIIVAVSVVVKTPTGTTIKIGSRQWKVTCITDEGDNDNLQGCTLGYWKQSQHFDSWEGYVPEDPGASRFDTVFGVTSHFTVSTPNPNHGPPIITVLNNPTLLDVLGLGGGGENGMGRQAVAALLNASSGSVNFKWTVGEVILIVQQAYAGTIPPYTGLDGHTYTGFDAAHYQFEDQFDGDSRPNKCPLN